MASAWFSVTRSGIPAVGSRSSRPQPRSLLDTLQNVCANFNTAQTVCSSLPPVSESSSSTWIQEECRPMARWGEANGGWTERRREDIYAQPGPQTPFLTRIILNSSASPPAGVFLSTPIFLMRTYSKINQPQPEPGQRGFSDVEILCRHRGPCDIRQLNQTL